MTTQELPDHDKRQLLLMKEQIASFEAGSLHLGYLVRDLEALNDSLQSVPESWREAFHQEWWTLEQVFAVGLDRNEERLCEENLRLVEEAIRNMKRLLVQMV